MNAIPMPPNPNIPQGHIERRSTEETDWMRMGVGATLLAGSILLLTKQRKLGLLVTAAGTALAALEHKDVVREWWDALPQYLDKTQHLLDEAQKTVDDIAAKRDRVMALFNR